MRLKKEELLQNKLFYLPIEVRFLSKEAAFKDAISQFIETY